ncbi:sulfurtransferase TusA family protein [Labrys wisconsinensis]|uniref:tRNA 2-thiouridine synthesizing protein A n=1 Tax=Labrys wisconsinensis TaxID=425677 RepID=A0ABU0J9C1_9HYPH|nr:sulfurtransferase TusA family protein [Labrys wisconsinensis]MDQ0470875.1 tRNA 2-thiouridine synthesizing protein A [Labrys wisconsinensis]
MDEIRLDLRGLKCPLPVLRTRKALRAAAPGALVVATCTDPMAAIDLPNLARETGDTLEDQVAAQGYVEFRIRKAKA